MPLREHVSGWVERGVGVVLRVPSLLLLEVLYLWEESVGKYLPYRGVHKQNFSFQYLSWNVYILGYILALTIFFLPLKKLVQLYTHILAAVILLLGHLAAGTYIAAEIEQGYEGLVFYDDDSFHRFVVHLVGQSLAALACSYLVGDRRLWPYSASLIPLLAKLCMMPLGSLKLFHTFAALFTSMEVLYFIARNLFVPYSLVLSAQKSVRAATAVVGWFPYVLYLWNKLAVSSLFLAYWCFIFAVQVYLFLGSINHPVLEEGTVILLLASMAECCGSPYALLGLCFTVSYVAQLILTLTKLYLQGFEAFMHDNIMHRGVTEGLTLLLLALQTGLLELKSVQRTFLLSIVLFIVLASTIQSMHEITEPILLALGASQNKSFWKHLRSITMCLFLLTFPLYMTFLISSFFDVDLWLLIIISSCILTSLHAVASMFMYALFMIDGYRNEPWENLDDIVYAIKATCKTLEFIVALCVVYYGAKEALFGEWTWIGASVIIVHCYFNVWQRAQQGWKSFLLRRKAVSNIQSLRQATEEELAWLDDVCAICFQELNSARVTPCSHYFHGACLRKWLYVQEKCPMCHMEIKFESDPQQDSPQENQDNERQHNAENVEEPRNNEREDPLLEGQDEHVHMNDNDAEVAIENIDTKETTPSDEQDPNTKTALNPDVAQCELEEKDEKPLNERQDVSDLPKLVDNEAENANVDRVKQDIAKDPQEMVSQDRSEFPSSASDDNPQQSQLDWEFVNGGNVDSTETQYGDTEPRNSVQHQEKQVEDNSDKG
ncbi:RING finger protein 145-like [Branchiostoma floridae x Branchiostoma japonicum]